ncbi:hypothetical protein [Kamptonema sp. UHCC 0994]|uniref:hypothetical protein n=1 Tax=Kamptonema sp. UHCC 0994 TaxID=3031329 RepID=UPI0023B955CE|nr:hypothetical protein [Kamptonema sp. UHCC 0994]MDF0551801.1 hypothetical protein [Kamptonema sp. UHCC 0994]
MNDYNCGLLQLPINPSNSGTLQVMWIAPAVSGVQLNRSSSKHFDPTVSGAKSNRPGNRNLSLERRTDLFDFYKRSPFLR